MSLSSTMTVAPAANITENAGSTSKKSYSADEFFTIDRMLKSHASQPYDVEIIGYPKTSVADFEVFTARHVDKFTNAAVAKYISSSLEPADSAQETAPVVAILASSSLEVVMSIFALNRLGWSVLFLSTRLSAPAMTRLLESSNCNTIITTKSHTPTIEEINKTRSCKPIPLLEPKDYQNVEAPKFQRDADPVKESRKIAWIIHSSGSTGFPKPIFLSNSACLANFRKNFGLRAFCTSPLFHSHGLMELFRAIYSKNPMFLGNYAFPVTRQNLVDALSSAKPELMCAVPYVLKLLAESKDGIEQLVNVKLVLFAGSSCPDELGDLLVDRGVNLVANYGATETGQIMTSFRPPGDKEWNYLRLHYPLANHVLMDEISPGVFECVALDGLPSKGPSNSMSPPNSFRTRDLFSRHPDPQKHNFWKYLSRLDDRVTLMNGEKVLPIPVEGRIRQDELVKEAAVFGVGRIVPGVIIFRSERASGLSDEEFTTAITPAIEAANRNAETFSRIPLELLILKSADTLYPRTDKGTFIRAQLYEKFAEDIENIYQSSDQGQTGTLQLDVKDLESFLMNRFRDDLNVNLESVDSDIFAAGVDSLQTTQMWRIIKKELDLGENGEGLSQNIVFEKGNVKSLARHLYSLRTGLAEEENDELEVMKDMIEKYSLCQAHEGTVKPSQSNSHVGLVTGATGSIGTHLVADLVKRNDVSKVWTLVRAESSEEARTRVLNSLSSRNLELSDQETSKIITLPSNFSRPDLGLSSTNLEELALSLTHVIHSAWAVNFNLGVRSFESQHIAGTHNLINLCLRSHLSSPAKFFFCSSVSAAGGTPKPATIPESAIEDLSHAQKMGYGRSKLVSEHIVLNAMRKTGMHARVLRIDQVSGDSVNGHWNETEAVALMIRSAMTVGALPALDETPSWLPVDICSRTILDLVFSSSPHKEASANDISNLVYHIINPHKFHWTQDLLPALQHTNLPQFDVVEPIEWLSRLKASNADPIQNPSIKLVDFWEGKYGSGPEVDKEESPNKEESGLGMADPVKQTPQVVDEDLKGLSFETLQTVQSSPTLAKAPDIISEGYVQKYVNSWLNRWVK